MADLADEIEACLPHVRGDEPDAEIAEAERVLCLPHVRGDEPNRRVQESKLLAVCPTCVGMNHI